VTTSHAGILFTPTMLADFERNFARLERLGCDVLVTPHPGASNLSDRLAAKDGAKLVDRTACARYARAARQALARRVASEKQP
jgi:metallo-beta-lactamase class B